MSLFDMFNNDVQEEIWVLQPNADKLLRGAKAPGSEFPFVLVYNKQAKGFESLHALYTFVQENSVEPYNVLPRSALYAPPKLL